MNWTCPHCDRAQTLTKNASVDQHSLSQQESIWGKIVLNITNITCANDECKKLTLFVKMFENEGYKQYEGYITGVMYHYWPLLPDSVAKVQPDYVPAAVREDYEEACKIRDLSPKASATLARRCLQGMIRDFCGISKARLIDEIKELRARVDRGDAPKGVLHDSVDAIDHVRDIGNIGAHMEKDINVIVEIDPDEASILIGLIELLFREWYVAQHLREERLAELKSLAAAKTAAKRPMALPIDDRKPAP